MVRPAFRGVRWHQPEMRNVVIVAGSGRVAHDWAFLVVGNTVDRTNWGAVSLVVGATFEVRDLLARQCAASGVRLHIGLSATDLAAQFAHAGVALITGGMVVYEAVTVGVPALVFPQLANLVDEAAWFAERGCIHNLTFAEGMNPRRIATATRIGLL